MELRRGMSAEYGIDLRSRSDAQVAERVLEHELSSRGAEFKKAKPPAVHRYRAPDCLSFATPELQQLQADLAAADFPLNNQGRVGAAEEIKDRVVKVADQGYRLWHRRDPQRGGADHLVRRRRLGDGPRGRHQLLPGHRADPGAAPRGGGQRIVPRHVQVARGAPCGGQTGGGQAGGRRPQDRGERGVRPSRARPTACSTPPATSCRSRCRGSCTCSC